MRSKLIVLAAVGLITSSVLAQQPAPNRGQQPEKPGQTMSMDGMMAGCREHCEATTKSIDQMTKMMNDARASNDAVRMRAALEQSAKSLEEMKSHMNMCRNMMGMMEKMHGQGGMMGQPSQQKK